MSSEEARPTATDFLAERSLRSYRGGTEADNNNIWGRYSRRRSIQDAIDPPNSCRAGAGRGSARVVPVSRRFAARRQLNRARGARVVDAVVRDNAGKSRDSCVSMAISAG